MSTSIPPNINTKQIQNIWLKLTIGKKLGINIVEHYNKQLRLLIFPLLEYLRSNLQKYCSSKNPDLDQLVKYANILCNQVFKNNNLFDFTVDKEFNQEHELYDQEEAADISIIQVLEVVIKISGINIASIFSSEMVNYKCKYKINYNVFV